MFEKVWSGREVCISVNKRKHVQDSGELRHGLETMALKKEEGELKEAKMKLRPVGLDMFKRETVNIAMERCLELPSSRPTGSPKRK